MKLYLDDERHPPIGWTLTKNVKVTINLLAGGNVTDLSLDHDLGVDYENGYDVLLWIEKQVFTNPEFKLPDTIKIHTANPSARKKMELALKRILSKYNDGK